MESFATAVEVLKIAYHAINMALEKLDKLVIDVAEHTIIDTLEICSSDQNKVFLCRAILNALKDLPASILQNDTRIRDAI